MPAVRPRRPSPKLDMNPMVDLAFLLVTFFMLTTTFRTEEPVLVDVPASHSEIKLPDVDMLLITVSEDGRAFVTIEGQDTRRRVLGMMAGHYGVGFSAEQLDAFGLVAGFGVPLERLGAWLELPPSERMRLPQPGIPSDSLNNELRDWTVFTRIANPRVRVAVKGARRAPFPLVKEVMDMLVENNINRFNLITELERSVPVEP